MLCKCKLYVRQCNYEATTYLCRSRLPCTPADLDITLSPRPRTLLTANVVFPDSNMQWNKHTQSLLGHVHTSRTWHHSFSTPTHFATNKCDVSRPPYAVEQTYACLSQLWCAPAKLDPTRSHLRRTLLIANIVFLKSRAQWNRHTPVFLVSRAHHQNWTPLVLDSHTLCH